MKENLQAAVHEPETEAPPIFYALTAPFVWLMVALLSVAFGSMVLVAFPFALACDKSRHSLHAIALLWARCVAGVLPGLSYEITGTEHLAAPGEPVIYVANHQSQADILALFLLNTRFRWMAKASLFYIPIFGWAMKAVGYVSVHRETQRSRARSVLDCKKLLKQGVPVAMFPEGTRSCDGVLKNFKAGAFRLSQETKAPLIPITIQGTDRLLPKGCIVPRSAFFKVTIHPRVLPAEKTAQELLDASRTAIASALPPRQRGKSSTPIAEGTLLASESALASCPQYTG